MTGLLIYGSSRGNTKLVADRVRSMLDFPVVLIDAKNVEDVQFFDSYDPLLFFASTWGDGELQIDMEDLLFKLSLDLKGKKYAICELGNYYGYDDFEFGAMRIMRHYLVHSGADELIQPFSMDSLPHKDWAGLQRWCDALNQEVGSAK